jgi:hypothetical protein
VRYVLEGSGQRSANRLRVNAQLIDAETGAFAHFCLGRVKVYTKRAAQGIAECERALALDRNVACSHAHIGLAKVFIRNKDGHRRGHLKETRTERS